MEVRRSEMGRNGKMAGVQPTEIGFEDLLSNNIYIYRYIMELYRIGMSPIKNRYGSEVEETPIHGNLR